MQHAQQAVSVGSGAHGSPPPPDELDAEALADAEDDADEDADDEDPPALLEVLPPPPALLPPTPPAPAEPVDEPASPPCAPVDSSDEQAMLARARRTPIDNGRVRLRTMLMGTRGRLPTASDCEGTGAGHAPGSRVRS